MARVLVLLSLLAVASSGTLQPALKKRELTPLLRCRGGASSDGASVRRAAQKLCTQPGLVANAGQSEGDFARLARRHVRGVVFGGMDGILTTFALLAAVEGSQQTSPTLTLVIGVSTVLADALSMGAGEYLSAKAEAELSDGPVDDNEPGPIEKGVAMFLAFTAFGALPLIGCVFSTALSRTTLQLSESASFALSVAITGGTLFALGAIKSQFGDGVWWRAGFEVSGIGGAAASVAYFTARVVEMLMGES